MSDEHSSPIKNWKQLLVVIHLALLVPVILIIIVTQILTGRLRGPSPESAAAVNSRIKPVGDVVLAPAGTGTNAASVPLAAMIPPSTAGSSAANSTTVVRPPATSGVTTVASAAPAGANAVLAAAGAAAPGASNGKQIYDTTCMVCHATGVAGAPKFGNKAEWAPRIKTGIDTLHAVALKGKGAMPPKGGNNALSDAEVVAAADYMIAAGK